MKEPFYLSSDVLKVAHVDGKEQKKGEKDNQIPLAK